MKTLSNQELSLETVVANTLAITIASGATFATVVYDSEVPVAAAHKKAGVVVTKQVTANVTLFGTLKDATQVYLNAVKKSANKIVENDQSKIDSFAIANTYFVHTNIHSIIKHKVSPNKYLYAFYNNSKAIYFINGNQVNKDAIAQYLTSSELKKQFAGNVTYNVGNDVLHTLVCRTIALHNIKKIRVRGKTFTF